MKKGFYRTSQIVGAAVFALALSAQVSHADTEASELSVAATVVASCALGTSPVAFGDVDMTTGQPVNATGSLLITCTPDLAWYAEPDAGEGEGATIESPLMTREGGGATLLYNLYTDAAHTNPWDVGYTNENANGSAITGTGTGSQQTVTVYGRIPSGQAVAPSGAYADTITVTLHW